MSNELNIKEIFQIIYKRLWMVTAIVVITSCLTGFLSYFVLQPIYEASTKIIVNQSNRQPVDRSLSLEEVNTNLRLIDTYKEIIRTPAIMDIVVQQHPEFELSAEQLMSKIVVSSVVNTQVMTIKVTDPSYKKATQIVNAVSAAFEKKTSTIFQVDNVTILSQAKLSPVPSPIKPNPKLNIAISFVVSLMVAVGITFLLEYLDDTIKTEHDVQQYLELPTLATFREWEAEDTGNRDTTTKAIRKGTEPTVPLFTKEMAMNRANSPMLEAYRMLRTNIDFSVVDHSIQTIMITSVGTDEGKSTTVAHLAASYAQDDKKVLIIDADMRKPTCHRTFGISNRLGLSNVVTGQAVEQEVIQESAIKNLYILPSGLQSPNSAELLGSKRMDELLEQLKQLFDYIIIDTPSILATTDASIMSSKCDGVILVIHSGKVKRELVMKAKENLKLVRAKVLGAVLNRVKQRK